MMSEPLSFEQLLKNLLKNRGGGYAVQYGVFALFKHFFHPKQMDLHHITTMLFMMPSKGLGDGIIFTGLFKKLHDLGYQVYIFCKKQNTFFYENDPHIKGVIAYVEKMPLADIAKQAKDVIFDLSIDLYGDSIPTLKRLDGLLALKPRYSIGFNGSRLYRNVMDEVIDDQRRDQHITHRACYLLRHLGLDDVLPPYQLPIPQTQEVLAQAFFKQFTASTYIIFNPFASNTRRSLTLEQIRQINTALDQKENTITFLIGEQDKLKSIDMRGLQHVVQCPLESFFAAAALVKQSSLVLSVETSIVHVAKVFNKKLVSIYSSEQLDGLPNDVLFAPNYANAVQLIAPSGAAANLDVAEILRTVDEKLKIR